MCKTKLLVLVSSALIIGFFCGAFYGFKEGVDNFALLDQVSRGAFSQYQLKSIEKNNIDRVSYVFELNIDQALHRYVVYEKEGNKFFSEYYMPELTSKLNEYVELMVDYRRNHPIVVNPEFLLPNDSDNNEMKESKANMYRKSSDMLRDIKTLLKSRGVKEYSDVLDKS